MTEADTDRWQFAIRREYWCWYSGEPCSKCGEWVGHFGGSVDRDPCPRIPTDVPLEEVRPNCYRVQANWIGDRIRHALDQRGPAADGGPEQPMR